MFDYVGSVGNVFLFHRHDTCLTDEIAGKAIKLLLSLAAVIAPRFATMHHQDSFDPCPDRAQAFIGPGSLAVSDGVGDSVREELSRRGHTIDVKAAPIAAPVMLYIDQSSGIYYAAGDPKANRHAAGLRDT